MALLFIRRVLKSDDDDAAFGNERFSVVEKAARRFLRYERKQGNEWKTAWENDVILPDGEMGWLI